MGYTTGQVAAGFDRTSQTIRDWIKHPLLHEFFSTSARRDGKRGQAELFAADVEVCNTIQVLLGQGLNWSDIHEKLRDGFRDTNLPDKFLMLDDDPRSPSNVMLMTKLAAAQETINANERIEQMYRDRIDELKAQVAKSDHDREEALKKLYKYEVELELWRAGRLNATASDDAGEG